MRKRIIPSTVSFHTSFLTHHFISAPPPLTLPPPPLSRTSHPHSSSTLLPSHSVISLGSHPSPRSPGSSLVCSCIPDVSETLLSVCGGCRTGHAHMRLAYVSLYVGVFRDSFGATCVLLYRSVCCGSFTLGTRTSAERYINHVRQLY